MTLGPKIHEFEKITNKKSKNEVFWASNQYFSVYKALTLI